MASRGLTLLEVIVSLGIFSAVLLVSNSVFTQLILTQRRDISEQELQEDIRLAVELLGRETRTAYASSFSLQPAQGSTGPALIFRDQNGTCIMHRREDSTWKRSELTTSDNCHNVTFENFNSLTGKNTLISDLNFRVPVDIADDTTLFRQGIITTILEAKSAHTSIPPIKLQTTLTSRQVQVYGQ